MSKVYCLRLHVMAVAMLTAIACQTSSMAAQGSGTVTGDKTLVAWVSLRMTDRWGGSVLTLQRGNAYDGIVLGGDKEPTWIAGSDDSRRTRHEPDYGPQSLAESMLIQVAVAYQGDRITIYRNGRPLSSYRAENIDLLSGTDQAVTFALGDLVSAEGGLVCAIEDARIYARALSATQINALEPNRVSGIEPWAWWDFEGDRIVDRAGRFTVSRTASGAKIADGKLLLGENATLVATRNEQTMAWAVQLYPKLETPEEYKPKTPTLPEEIPENWLTYHLAHPGPDDAQPGDPNFAYFYKGRYHLHYIVGNEYGLTYAHVSSDDMVHWKWHPTVLASPLTRNEMCSGTGFFTRDGRPAAIYHGMGLDLNCVVFGQGDTLDAWSDPRPLLVYEPDGRLADIPHWDPDCFLRDDTYYAISGGGPPLLMKSNDLERWEYLGKLFDGDTDWDALGVDPNEDVSCPNMFKIGDEWMLLCISHDLGCRYYLGDFDGDKFLPESHHMMNWVVPHYFAPESLLTPDGRRVMWAWCSRHLETSTSQTGVQSLPRELSLPEDGVLRIKPLRELEQLRGNVQDELQVYLEAGDQYRLTRIEGDTLELSVKFDLTDAKRYGVRVLCDDQGRGMVIQFDADAGTITAGLVEAPLELEADEALDLRIFLDKELVEVFANERQALVARHEREPGDVGIELFSEGSAIQAAVKGWLMRSIYESR